MSNQFFFGYGSLVNTSSHTFGDISNARLIGWRRVWQRTNLRNFSFLSVHKTSESSIDGVIANVPNGDVGDNFAAGMTGGMAFVYDKSRELEKKINAFEYSSIEWRPLNYIELDKDQSNNVAEVLTSLEDLDDVQNIFTNANLKNLQ